MRILPAIFARNSITTYYSDQDVGVIPILTRTGILDVTQGSAESLNAAFPQRLTLGMMRFNEPAALTPVGAAQAIVVTGYTKVIVTPVSAASISTATFDSAVGAGTDFGRNGWLVIEAGNGNLTINHTASGADVFVMTAGSNLSVASGQMVQFLRSETNGNWRQI